MPDIFVATQKSQESAPKNEDSLNEKPMAEIDSYSEKTNSVHLFTSFSENPNDITFENQEEGEKVLLFIRKDFITNLPWLIGSLFFVLLPIAITPIMLLLHIPIFFIPQKFILLFTIFYYLIVTIFTFVSFITWYFNLNIVTEKRILDIEFAGVVYKNIAATKLNLIQDVSYTQAGVFRTVFDFGDVLIQTAGTIDNFTFEAVPRPEDAVHIVENLIGKRNEQV